ncbi:MULTISPECIES: hypothetical protein [unclassified Roseateles]|jgi:hypothetical protein|uniref:Uncharacterized protein n=1 Tax=Roseateles hydrophilus TaxID=2975054 RepID=A0ACC6CF91_9BURK|nr:hypothetical protein [Pelomonas sp. UHG3]MCY4747056.1 hypothetical protein [Pelomonas sp. UHG3]
MKLLLPLLAVGLVACAAAPQTGDTLTADTTCERETRIGSNLPTTRCRSAAQREEDRRRAEAIGENIKPGAASTIRGGS